MRRLCWALVWTSALFITTVSAAHAQTVWSGYDFTFAKPNFGDPSSPANQDRLTDNVWITRSVNGGIFNATTESEYLEASPADTAWATDINNEGETISAENWADLTFEPWIAAYGGLASQQLPARLIGRNAVVHLISDDIYLDLRFTAWTQGGGGGFAYERALAPEEPDTTGDYNEDGFVDAADYVYWRKTFNESVDPDGSGADGDADGTIDLDDYDFWVEQFGTTVQGSGGALAVPEPTSLALWALAILPSWIHAHRRR